MVSCSICKTAQHQKCTIGIVVRLTRLVYDTTLHRDVNPRYRYFIGSIVMGIILVTKRTGTTERKIVDHRRILRGYGLL
jgi:hypothetical protein